MRIFHQLRCFVFSNKKIKKLLCSLRQKCDAKKFEKSASELNKNFFFCFQPEHEPNKLLTHTHTKKALAQSDHNYAANGMMLASMLRQACRLVQILCFFFADRFVQSKAKQINQFKVCINYVSIKHFLSIFFSFLLITKLTTKRVEQGAIC
jgi:hypothetical protein